MSNIHIEVAQNEIDEGNNNTTVKKKYENTSGK